MIILTALLIVFGIVIVMTTQSGRRREQRARARTLQQWTEMRAGSCIGVGSRQGGSRCQ